jgi:gamma-glutamylputrescine oxidase
MIPSRRSFLKNSALIGSGALLGAAGLNQVSPSIWHQPLQIQPNDSFWARSQPAQNPELDTNLTVDVAVLGGGFTGLSAAYFIRRLSPHKRVVVLEARGCGNGASGRNGAMVLTMTADRFMNFGSDPSIDKRIYDLTVENIRFLTQLSSATGVDCELDIRGALQALDSDSDVREAKAYVRRAQSLGIPVEFWDAPRIADALGTKLYAGGFFDPNGGHVHPMKLVRVFKAAAESAGATIYENTMVNSVEPGEEHLISTNGGRTVRAKSLVLATNAFTPGLGFLRNLIVPLHEYIAVTQPFSEQELVEIGWNLRVPFNDCRIETVYLGLTQDRRIHIGGGAPRYAFNNRASGAGELRSHLLQLQRELARIYPKLAGVEFAQSWEGVIDWSLDESPSVGCIGRQKNIFYGIGYSGHGVNLTSIFGRIIADLEAGREELWKQYPFVNNHLYYVPNEPFRWLAAQTGISLLY